MTPEAEAAPAPSTASSTAPADTPADPRPDRDLGRLDPAVRARRARPEWPTRRSPRMPLDLLAGLFGLLALLCAAALPFAPVTVSAPTVSWPQRATVPEPTTLLLTAYRPLTLDVRVSCDAVRAAAGTGDRTVVATMRPDSAAAGASGLVVTATGTPDAPGVRVSAVGRVLLDAPIPTGSCLYTVHADGDGTVLDLDGARLASAFGATVPDVDLLTTSVTALPARGDLAVTMRVDDEMASSPTPAKTVLTWLAGVLALAALLCLVLVDRRTDRARARWRWRPPALVDLLVPAVMTLWLFLAPSTDDDGYYAAMARNFRASGFVGNFYQLYDQSFVPFTWFYHLLAWWQTVAGDSAPAQRVPALVFGLIAWAAVRRFTATALREAAPDRRWIRSLSRTVLGITFLAWWLPQDMGVRPESAVTVGGALALLGVAVAVRRSRLSVAWLAFVAAAAGFAVHPTGFTALAPIVAGLPALWQLVRTPSVLGTLARAVAVVSGATVASLLAFTDGAFRDFLRGQEIFLGIQDQNDWADEIQRYNFLLTNIAMGSYAKRVAVLVTVVALLWFAVLVAAARARRLTVPWPLMFSGCTAALAFLLLWPTPSKWTHHFGALAATCSAFLALLIVLGIPLARRLEARLPVPLLAAVAGSFVLALALAGQGPNAWPYTWLIGIRRPEKAPAVSVVEFGDPLWWLLGLAVIVGILALGARLRGTRDLRLHLLRAVPAMVVLGLLANVVYLVGTFGLAVDRTSGSWSFWGDNFRDPGARDCNAARAVRVLDPAGARTLTPATGLPEPAEPQGFAADGFPRGDGPPLPPGRGMFAGSWGSFVARDGTPEATTGQVTTPWWDLPTLPADGSAQVAVLAAGTLEQGNSLVAEFGRRAADGTVRSVDTVPLTDTASDTIWRTFALPDAGGRADLVRLTAVDRSGGIGGWLAFTAPAVAQQVPLREALPAGAVALSWQVAFQFPCLPLPRVADGITEPPRSAVVWGDPSLSGFDDATWQPFRGGLFGQVRRISTGLQLATTLDGVPEDERNLEVYLFDPPYPADAYDLARGERVTGGGDAGTDAPPRPSTPEAERADRDDDS
ncbi:arabinosyltransferase EmbC [Pseudonocardia yuanmonensis]|uniref:Arabinosyltransferase EmbC n=1 Tax=Pseudonocardia yuanmonensis TaxID=1095914 RepID=A0ABP8WFM6_9PSEU